jgi:hypothetical protein
MRECFARVLPVELKRIFNRDRNVRKSRRDAARSQAGDLEDRADGESKEQMTFSGEHD